MKTRMTAPLTSLMTTLITTLLLAGAAPPVHRVAYAAPCNYFPESYTTSKARFLKFANSLRVDYRGVETDSIVVGRERLTVDTIFIPAQEEAKKLVILTSGTHGPEGYAGSALQALFVEEILGGLNLRHTGVLLVHALNPWGFKHHRRDTENNINLNRNFDISSRLFSTQNDGYKKLQKYLELRGRVESASQFPAKDLLWEMISQKEVTQQSLVEAIGKGQYVSSLGINYGGNDFETQTVEMIALLKRVAAPYGAIFHIDLHTGLGKKRVMHIMTKKRMNAVSRQAQARLFDPRRDAGQYEITPPEADGFYEILGDYADILGKLFPEKDRVIIGITAEFGTVGNGLRGKVATINRLVLENQGHHHGYADRETEAVVRKRYLELFYPSNAKWRSELLLRGRYLLDTVVKRFIASRDATGPR